jgi:hypothetical protein
VLAQAEKFFARALELCDAAGKDDANVLANYALFVEEASRSFHNATHTHTHAHTHSHAHTHKHTQAHTNTPSRRAVLLQVRHDKAEARR